MMFQGGSAINKIMVVVKYKVNQLRLTEKQYLLFTCHLVKSMTLSIVNRGSRCETIVL